MGSKRARRAPRFGVGAALLISLFACAEPAAGAVGDITTFVDPTGNVNGPGGVSAGPDGNMWFTNFDGMSGDGWFGRITMTGDISTFFPTNDEIVPQSTVTGPDGMIWFTSACNPPCTTFYVGRLDPFAPDPAATIEAFTAPSIQFPAGITVGPDGAIWFTNLASSTIGRIDPLAPDPAATITAFADPAGQVTNPPAITTGPDDNLWFTNAGGSLISRITPGGTITNFDGAAAGVDEPVGITVGPDAKIWFASFENRRLGRLDPSAPDPGATIETFADPSGMVQGPGDVVTGPDGGIWFTDASPTGGGIGRLDPRAPDPGATYAVFTNPNAQSPSGLAVGPDCHLWFGSQGNNRIGRIETGVPPPCPPPPPAPIEPITPPVPLPIVVSPRFTG